MKFTFDLTEEQIMCLRVAIDKEAEHQLNKGNEEVAKFLYDFEQKLACQI